MKQETLNKLRAVLIKQSDFNVKTMTCLIETAKLFPGPARNEVLNSLQAAVDASQAQASAIDELFKAFQNEVTDAR